MPIVEESTNVMRLVLPPRSGAGLSSDASEKTAHDGFSDNLLQYPADGHRALPQGMVIDIARLLENARRDLSKLVDNLEITLNGLVKSADGFDHGIDLSHASALRFMHDLARMKIDELGHHPMMSSLPDRA